MWGRLAASWHGMAPQRRVLMAASLVVLAGGLIALGAFTIVDFQGSAPLQTGPAADHAAPQPSLPHTPSLNATSSAPPVPLPTPLPSQLPAPLP